MLKAVDWLDFGLKVPGSNRGPPRFFDSKVEEISLRANLDQEKKRKGGDRKRGWDSPQKGGS